MKWTRRLFPAIIAMSIAMTGCYEEKAKIVDDFWYGYNNQYNGWCAAQDGDYAVVGSLYDDNSVGSDAGSANIFEKSD
jgi:hypothetical protein